MGVLLTHHRPAGRFLTPPVCHSQHKPEQLDLPLLFLQPCLRVLKSPWVTHAAASSSKVRGRSLLCFFKESFAQLVLGDDIFHPGDVK